MVRANKGTDPDMHRGIKTSYSSLMLHLKAQIRFYSADGPYVIVGTYTY